MSAEQTDRAARARAAHRRTLGWTVLAVLLGALVAPLTGYVYTAMAQEAEPASPGEDFIWSEENPRGETFREVRRGTEATTTAFGPYITDEFIHNGGENWRNFRNGPVAGVTPWFMALAVLVLGAFYIWHGPDRVEQPPTGRVVRRWSTFERWLHWFVAITFILMAITGLSLLLGRAFLIPILGHEGFGAWAYFSKYLHNILGPFFFVGLLLMIVIWMRDNLPIREDIDWLMKAARLREGKASAGRFNAGEKLWYWFMAVGGIIVCVSGLVLDFPLFGQTRGSMQIANIVHGVLSIFWIAGTIGHIYVGTLGTPGAFSGMTAGHVTEEWAAQHHDLWLEDVKRRAAQGESDQLRPRASGGAAGPARSEP